LYQGSTALPGVVTADQGNAIRAATTLGQGATGEQATQQAADTAKYNEFLRLIENEYRDQGLLNQTVAGLRGNTTGTTEGQTTGATTGTASSTGTSSNVGETTSTGTTANTGISANQSQNFQNVLQQMFGTTDIKQIVNMINQSQGTSSGTSVQTSPDNTLSGLAGAFIGSKAGSGAIAGGLSSLAALF
jgi:hypothetical protein